MPTDLPPLLDLDIGASVRQLADQDPALGSALRVMAWDAYAQAGRPLGPGENAMWAWWAYGQSTTVQ